MSLTAESKSELARRFNPAEITTYGTLYLYTFRSILGGRRYRRIWWAWFSVAWWPGAAHEYGNAIREGEWRDK